jgi:hypothetical protein
MKLAGLPKFLFVSILAGASLLTLSGCGSVAKNGGSDLSLTAGNWTLTATSSGANGTFYIGGNISQTGTAVSAKLYITSTLCFDPSQAITFTGTVSGKNVTLTSAIVNSQVVTIAATGTSGSALTGTYTLTGGSCASGDTGTVAATVTPSLTGTWNGPIVGDYYNDQNATLSLALTQASTASTDGTFALTGTVTYTSSSCSSTGTISGGSVAGSALVMQANTIDFIDGSGAFGYAPLLNNSATPTSMTGTYDVSMGDCAGDTLSLTLTKQ